MRIRFPFAIAFLFLLIVASSAGLLPHSVLPSAPESAQPYIPKQSDKALHFLIFFFLTLTFYFILDTARRRVLHLTLLVCTLLLSVGSEIVQHLLPINREFDPFDVLANVVGSLCALGLATAYHRRALERRRRAKYSTISGEGVGDDDEDLELGEGSGLGVRREDGDGQETGIVSAASTGPGRPGGRTVEEELDNWDENQPDDDWDVEGDDDTTTNTGTSRAKMTPATSSGDNDEPPPHPSTSVKLAKD